MKPRALVGILCSVVAPLASAACGAPEAGEQGKIPFTADVLITSDPGTGTPGAELVAGGQRLATTDASGHARVSLQGTEGDSLEISVRCPAGFQSPAETIGVSLRRLSSGSRSPSFVARCAPLTRTVVVGIRTENGANLPVIYLGKEVGRTDAWGAAHIVLTVKANEQVNLGLDTAAVGSKRPKLRPESPTLTFVAKDIDDFVTLEQKFDVEWAAAGLPRAAPRGGPTRI
ncbi:hypothetical protein BH11MYX4_BH11MYX4_47460 [soil metagenome]